MSRKKSSPAGSFLRLLVFGLTGAVRDKLLDRSGQPCQRLHIAGDDDLGGLAVGHLRQRSRKLLRVRTCSVGAASFKHLQAVGHRPAVPVRMAVGLAVRLADLLLFRTASARRMADCFSASRLEDLRIPFHLRRPGPGCASGLRPAGWTRGAHARPSSASPSHPGISAGGRMFLSSTRLTLMPHLSVAVSRVAVILVLMTSREVQGVVQLQLADDVSQGGGGQVLNRRRSGRSTP